MEHESDGDSNYNWCARYNHQRTGTRTERNRNKSMNGNHPTTALLRSARILRRVLET